MFCGMYSQPPVTHTLTLCRSLDHWMSLCHWRQWQSSAVKLETNLRYTVCVCLYFCSSCLYIFTYKHKFSFKMTVSACVRNSWEDTVAVLLLLWKILTWKCCTVREFIRVKEIHLLPGLKSALYASPWIRFITNFCRSLKSNI